MSGLLDHYRFGAGGAGPGAHRYWRINMTANQGGGATYGITELELHAGLYGGNVATGGTAAASTTGSGAAANVFNGAIIDNSSANYWQSTASGAPQWLQYDFGMGNDVEIGAVVLWSRSGGSLGMTPTAYDVQYSDDGAGWTTAWSTSGLAWVNYQRHRSEHPSLSESYSGSPWGAHQYWQFDMISSDRPALAEVDMATSPGGGDVLSSSTLTVASTLGGFPIANARDNNASSLYSANTTGIQWIRADFGGSPVEYGEWIWQARPSSLNFSPTNVVIRYADSTSGPWTSILQDIPGVPTAGQIFTLTDPLYV